MAYKRKSKAISILLTIVMLVMLWPGAAYAAPTITNAQMDNLLGPNYIRAGVNFSEGIYGDANKTSAISKDDFALTVNSNGGAVTNAVINAIHNGGNNPPKEGEKNFLFFINLTGGPPSGTETITIRPAVGDAVYGSDEFMAADEEAVFTLWDKRVEFADGYPKAGSDQAAGSKQVQLAVKSLYETVTVFYVVVANNVTQPSVNQVMAGQDSAGQPAIAEGSQAADTGSDTIITATLPEDATDYDAWVVIRDTAGNVTVPVKVDVKTPDASGAPSGSVCQIGSTGYASLDEALAAVTSATPATIELLQDINYNSGMLIEGKNITFDLNGFTLNVSNPNATGAGLSVTNGGSVDYVDNTASPGQFNVTGSEFGVYTWGVNKYSSAKVTNATATKVVANNDAHSCGAYARYNAQITVTQNAQGNKFGAYADDTAKVIVHGSATATNTSDPEKIVSSGAIATNYADVEVKGNVQGGHSGVYTGNDCTAKIGGNAEGRLYGAYSEYSTIEVAGDVKATADYYPAACAYGSNSVVTVGGDATATGTDGAGARALYGGLITINGEITAKKYVQVGGTGYQDMEQSEGILTGDYYIYTNASNSTVKVKTNAPSGNACQIGSTEYATLDEALATVPEENPTAVNIKLLRDITDNDGISIKWRKIILDLNGKTLTINNSSGVGFGLQLRSEVNVTGTGNLIITSSMAGLNVNESTFTVSEEIPVSITSTQNAGISADTNCNILINGNVTGATAGIYASSDNSIIVGGTVTAAGNVDNHAVYLNYPDNTVSVGSAIVSSGTGAGVYIGTSGSGGSVTVGSETKPGQVVGKGHGIWARNPSTITVYGNVVGGSRGLNVENKCQIKIYGDVTSTASDQYGVYSSVNSDEASNIVIEGNVAGFNGVYIHGDQSEVTVTGNVRASGNDRDDTFGVRASYAKAQVGGNIIAANCTGAYSAEESQITIDGTITAANYITVKYDNKAVGDHDAASTKAGYLQYSSYQNTYVWVKEAVVRQVTGIAVKTQPADLVYTAGEKLDLSGLVVTLTYNDSSTLDVDYEDFSYMNITANPANETPLVVATHHNQPIAVSCNGKTANTGKLTVTSAPSSGGGGGSSSAQRDSIISDVVETAGDKTLEKALIDTNKAVLSLAGSSSATTQISTAVINRLAEHAIPFTVVKTGVRLDFAPGSFDSDQVTAGGTLMEIGVREVTEAEKEEILDAVPAGQSTGLFEIGGKIFDLTALAKTGAGTVQRIENFGQPVAVTIDLSHLGDLTPEQINQLTGVRLEKDEQGYLKPVSLGGKYDPATKTFTFYTDKFSLYTVMRLAQSRQGQVIQLAINSPTATVNGSPYSLDAPPQLVNNRTLVPIRFVSEALGAQVTWDAATGQVTVKDAGRTMVLTLGSNQALVDGKPRAIDNNPAMLPPGRVFVPLRFVSETLGAKVDYNDTKQITITRQISRESDLY